jgi:drug/metabolite transporter (DMT)-like permease
MKRVLTGRCDGDGGRGATSTRHVAAVAFVAVSIIWGSTYFGIRVALEDFPPFLIGALRFLAAGAILFAIGRARGEPSPRAVEWRSACATGALLFVVGNGLVNVAERSVSSGLASVLVATMPLWAVLYSRLFGERARKEELVGVCLGLVGVSVMNASGQLRASPFGAAAALLAPMGWAFGSIASKRLPLPADTMMRTAAQMLTGGAAMLLVSLVLGEGMAHTPSLRATLALLYLCIFGSLIGFSAYAYLLANVRASVATSYAYVNPVIAVALGVVFLGERLDALSGVGAGIVMGAVVLVARARATRSAPPSASDAPSVDAPTGRLPASR